MYQEGESALQAPCGEFDSLSVHQINIDTRSSIMYDRKIIFDPEAKAEHDRNQKLRAAERFAKYAKYKKSRKEKSPAVWSRKYDDASESLA